MLLQTLYGLQQLQLMTAIDNSARTTWTKTVSGTAYFLCEQDYYVVQRLCSV